MSRSPLVLLPLLLTLVFSPARAQEHYTLGPINRVILVDIKPGKSSEFWTDLRQNLRPLYDEWKRQGLIQSYSVGVKTTAEGPQNIRGQASRGQHPSLQLPGSGRNSERAIEIARMVYISTLGFGL